MLPIYLSFLFVIDLYPVTIQGNDVTVSERDNYHQNFEYPDNFILIPLLLLVQVLMKVLSNVEACVLVGGCVLAVDLLTVVHEASERTAIPLQSNLIAATAFMEPLKEWMFMDKNNAQVGPVEKDAVRRFWSKAEIDWTTRCWAAGMPDWKRLRDIRELRWAMAVRVPVLTPVQV